MSEHFFSPPLRDAEAARLESLCLQFEADLVRGGKPSIEALLPTVAENKQAELLFELLLLEFRALSSQQRLLERSEYETRFPAYLPQVAEAWEVFQNAPTRPQAADDSKPSPAEVPISGHPVPQQIGRFPIVRMLGSGGFGEVYLGYQQELDRHVAIKIPKLSQMDSAVAERAFLEEARKLVKVKGTGIVVVHDVFPVTLAGQSRICIVQEFIDGQNLADWHAAQPKPIDPDRIARLVAEIATIMSAIHRQDIVHRDLKPANIMIDKAGQPYVLDFGLAIREEERTEQLGQVAGTWQYMSPEQIRGEAHHLDDRSDIWALGVILYELFSGRRPFNGSTRNELIKQVWHIDPKPLPMRNPGFPESLDRICRKCLQKHRNDRYMTMAELAADLRNWRTQSLASPAIADRAPGSPAAPRGVIPRGLRSFTEEDSGFFLELLPGVREPNGLPESIDFWKRRIESSAASAATASGMPLGLVYGPSGCGKSSLIKAGLLPRLAPRIIKIYLEATQDATEQQLLGLLRDRLPGIPPELGLNEVLKGLRCHRWLRSDEKVLIVIDQFEQWLYAHPEDYTGELSDALRQCDGRRVQAILMVRDDYWTPIVDFLKELDVDLAERKNCRKVSRFDLKHARKVLTLFGQAYGAFPENPDDLTADQNGFLDLAIHDLAEQGKVVSVRLAVFAELMHEKNWTLNTLQSLDGVQGVGVAFLQETFHGKDASPLRKRHAEAALRVLRALLPPPGTEIKGHSRTTEELAVAAGYSERSTGSIATNSAATSVAATAATAATAAASPVELLRILDEELRLITPAFNDQRQTIGYQLTHDYLVPSLSTWIENTLGKTRRGRALLRLEERSATWQAKEQDRQLPSLIEYVRIVTLTQRRNWTEPQRRMMRRAGRHLATVWGVLIMATTLTIAGAVWFYSAQKRESERNELRVAVDALQNAPASAVAYALKDLQRLDRSIVLRELEQRFNAKSAPGSVEDAGESRIRRLRLAQALASYGRADVDYLIASIAEADGGECDNLATALKTAPRSRFEPELLKAMHLADEAGRASKDWTLKAKLAIVGLHVGTPAVAIDLHRLRDRPDPTQQTHFIHDVFGGMHGDLSQLLKEAQTWDDAGLLYGLSLSLGKVPKRDFQASWVGWRNLMLRWHCDHPDSGVHSATGWALRRWGETLPDLSDPSSRAPPNSRNWWPHKLGFTLLRIPAGEFEQIDEGLHASALNEDNRRTKRKVRLSEYWISDREVTVGLYRRFLDNKAESKTPIRREAAETLISPSMNYPTENVSWFDAVLFCNWLSLLESRKPCYVCVRPDSAARNARGEWEVSVDPAGNGYRLLTEAEWEYACRAGSSRAFSFGDSDRWLNHYARFSANLSDRRSSSPVCLYGCNRYGAFDMHGNMSEWCRDRYARLPVGDVVDPVGPLVGSIRVVRGGKWNDVAVNCRSAIRRESDPLASVFGHGFRLALSIVAGPDDSGEDKKE
jgi:serine/threonine protein kinase/formylglycine-generating enzyme required for sulfatase activity